MQGKFLKLFTCGYISGILCGCLFTWLDSFGFFDGASGEGDYALRTVVGISYYMISYIIVELIFELLERND